VLASAVDVIPGAADREAAMLYTEPPSYPRPVVEGWGNVALAIGDFSSAERAYREALLLKPHHIRAKWNLELVNRMRQSSGQPNKPNPPPPPSPGKGGGAGGGGGGQEDQPHGQGAGGGLSEAQADQVLRSIGQEELRTRRDRAGRTRRAAPTGVKDW
jgi:hypothetical protein